MLCPPSPLPFPDWPTPTTQTVLRAEDDGLGGIKATKTIVVGPEGTHTVEEDVPDMIASTMDEFLGLEVGEAAGVGAEGICSSRYASRRGTPTTSDLHLESVGSLLILSPLSFFH